VGTYVPVRYSDRTRRRAATALAFSTLPARTAASTYEPIVPQPRIPTLISATTGQPPSAVGFFAGDACSCARLSVAKTGYTTSMARRMDHNRYTAEGKRSLHFGMLAAGVAIIPVARLLCSSNKATFLGAPLLVAGPVLILVALFGLVASFLQHHVEMQCPECGQVHHVERGVASFLCTSCGARVGSLPSGYEKKKR